MSPQFPVVTTKVNLTKHVEFWFVEKDLFSWYINQVINVFFLHWCNERWKFSIQRGKNGTFHFSPLHS